MSLLDAGFNTTVCIAHRRPIDLGATNRKQNREVLDAIATALAANDGSVDAVTGVINQSGTSAKAGASLIISGGSGAVGGTINGVTVTATWATSDTNSAGLVAAAINASSNALVQGFVRASNAFATLTLSSTAAGSTVRIRLGTGAQATEYVMTATAAATGRLGEFNISGTDTADATALCAAINAYPVLNQVIRAENVAGVAYLYAMDGTVTGRVVSVSGITLTAGMALGALVHVEVLQPGALGNAVTFAASGTGVTVANANTRCVGGLGGVTGTIKRANALGL